MIKKIIFFLVFVAGLQNIGAQKIFTKERLLNRENHDKRRYRWGYYLGLNSLDYKFDYVEERAEIEPELQDIQVNKQIGFNVGLIGNLRINDYLDLRTEPGVIFNTRTLTFPNVDSMIRGGNVREMQTTSVHIPILLKISTKRLNNFKPFIVGGLSTSINLSSNENNPDDNTAAEFRTKTNLLNYELGFGIDLFLPYFKFTPSIRGVFSTTDEIVQDNLENLPSQFTSQIQKMSTRGVFINFTFQ